MKNNFRIWARTSLLFFAGIFFASCSDKDPEACFTVPRVLVDAFQDLEISNCAYIPSEGYIDWDMGDGTTFGDVQANYAYTAQGTYTITQNAYGKNGSRVDTHTEVITVGRRLFKSIEIRALPNNPNGGNWDPTDNAPEVAFEVYLGSSRMYQSSTYPITLPISTAIFEAATTQFELTPVNWTFLVLDRDDLGDPHDTIVRMDYDLNTGVFNHQVPSFPGSHILSQGGIDLTINYDIVQ